MTGDGRFSEAFLAEVRARTSVVELVRRDVALQRAGREFKAPCPFHTETSPSFYVNDQKAMWHCFGCGAHGDAVGWMMRYHNMEFRDAVELLAQEAGMMPAKEGQASRPKRAAVERPTQAKLDEDAAREVERARQIWQQATPAGGTVVEAWLAARGIRVGDMGGVPPSLRFQRAMPYWVRRGKRWEVIGEWPAMVAGIQDSAAGAATPGRIIGVHITYLRADGGAKAPLPKHPDTGETLRARKMRGRKSGGTVRFTPAMPRMVLGEGIETVMTAPYVRPDLGAWSALDLGNLVGAGVREEHPRPHPERKGVWLPAVEPDMDRPGIVLPPVVREVILLGEASNGDRHAYGRQFERGCRRYARLGLTVRYGVPPVDDLNGWLMAMLRAAA